MNNHYNRYKTAIEKLQKQKNQQVKVLDRIQQSNGTQELIRANEALQKYQIQATEWEKSTNIETHKLNNLWDTAKNEIRDISDSITNNQKSRFTFLIRMNHAAINILADVLGWKQKTKKQQKMSNNLKIINKVETTNNGQKQNNSQKEMNQNISVNGQTQCKITHQIEYIFAQGLLPTLPQDISSLYVPNSKINSKVHSILSSTTKQDFKSTSTIDNADNKICDIGATQIPSSSKQQLLSHFSSILLKPIAPHLLHNIRHSIHYAAYLIQILYYKVGQKQLLKLQSQYLGEYISLFNGVSKMLFQKVNWQYLLKMMMVAVRIRIVPNEQIKHNDSETITPRKKNGSPPQIITSIGSSELLSPRNNKSTSVSKRNSGNGRIPRYPLYVKDAVTTQHNLCEYLDISWPDHHSSINQLYIHYLKRKVHIKQPNVLNSLTKGLKSAFLRTKAPTPQQQKFTVLKQFLALIMCFSNISNIKNIMQFVDQVGISKTDKHQVRKWAQKQRDKLWRKFIQQGRISQIVPIKNLLLLPIKSSQPKQLKEITIIKSQSKENQKQSILNINQSQQLGIGVKLIKFCLLKGYLSVNQAQNIGQLNHILKQNSTGWWILSQPMYPIPEKWKYIIPNGSIDYISMKAQVASNSTPSAVQQIISLDVHRSLHVHNQYLNPTLLHSLLRIYAYYHQDISYCQGMNYIAGYLFIKLRDEQASYRLFEKVMAIRFREVFINQFKLIKKMVYCYEKCLRLYHPEVAAYFEKQLLNAECYVVSWMITLFASSYQYTLQSYVIDVLWERFLVNGWTQFYMFIMWLIAVHKGHLLTLPYDRTLHFFGQLVKSEFFLTNQDIFKQLYKCDPRTQVERYPVTIAMLDIWGSEFDSFTK